MSTHKHWMVLLILLAASGWMFGCGGDDGGGSSNAGQASVRFVYAAHAAQGAATPLVDIWIDGQPPSDSSPLNDVGPNEASAFVDLRSGAHEIAVVKTGATLADTGSVYFTQQLTLNADTRTTLYAYGAASESDLSIASYEEPTPSVDTPGAGSVQARVIHAATGVTNVDLFVDGERSAITGVSPGAAAGPTTLEAQRAYVVGVAAARQSETAVDFDVTVPENGSWAVFVIGDTSTGLRLLAVNQAGTAVVISPVQYAFLRVIHVANTNAVELGVKRGDDEPQAPITVENLDRFAVSGGSYDGYYRLRKGEYELTLNEAGAGTVWSERTVTLGAGFHYTAFVYGDPAADDSGVGLMEDAGGSGDINVANAASDAMPPILYLDGVQVSDNSGATPGTSITGLDASGIFVRLGISSTSSRVVDPTFSFERTGDAQSLFLVGEAGSDTFPQQAVGLDADNAVTIRDPDMELRVLHTTRYIDPSSDDAPIDVYFNGTRIIDDLARLEGTSFMRLPSGDATVEIFIGTIGAGDEASPSFVITETLESRSRSTVVTGDTAGISPEPSAGIIGTEPRGDLPSSITTNNGNSGKLGVQVIHLNGAFSTTTLSLYDVTGTLPSPLVLNLPYFNAAYVVNIVSTAIEAINTGAYDFGVDFDKDDVVDLEYDNVNLAPSEGDIVQVYHVNDAGLPKLLVFQSNGATDLYRGTAP